MAKTILSIHGHFVEYFIFLVVINCLNFCGDWNQYKRRKCIKILDKKVTADNALPECMKLDNSSSLVVIGDQEEQYAINSFLEKFSDISMFAWIGMKYNGKEYKWVDGMDTEYDNWSDEAVRDGEDACVKMSLMDGLIGKWMDSSCKSRDLVVCQRIPKLSLNSLKEIIQNMSQIIDKIEERVGFHSKHLAERGYIFG